VLVSWLVQVRYSPQHPVSKHHQSMYLSWETRFNTHTKQQMEYF
jgi:hypothetical protein